MPSSEGRHRASGIAASTLAKCGLAVVVSVSTLSLEPAASAEPLPRGFALERLATAAPGSGFLVMDSLEQQGGLGGAMSVTLGYAHAPLRLDGDGGERLAVVSDQASVAFGFAATYDRYRLSLGFTAPIVTAGQTGTVSGTSFSAPSSDLASHPDTLGDARIGFDARLYGAVGAPLRLGLGAQLFIPNGSRDDYVTDDTYRAMARALLAGDLGRFTYAGHVGVHVRPLDEPSIVGSPRGSELLFGVAAGPRFLLGPRTTFVVAPEIYGETAFRAFLGRRTTGLEALLTGRMDHALEGPVDLRAKVGVGAGIVAELGAPEWRTVLSLEVSGHVVRGGP